MQIIVISSKSMFKDQSLIERLESKNAIFYGDYGVNIEEIDELQNKADKILALDEVCLSGGYDSLNKHLDKMINIKYICGISARYHEFDFDKAREKEIIYCNNPDTTSRSVADLAITLMFMLIRNIPLALKSDFEFYGINMLGREYTSQTVGVLGLGSIGSEIAKICQKLGMEIKFWSRKEKNTDYKQVDLKELLDQDIIFIALPTTNGTKKFFNENFFSNLNENNYVIDIGAGDDLYDKNKLIKMANEKQIAGYGLEAEHPMSEENYIDAIGNVIITPHIGWGTQEGYSRLYTGWTNTILSCLNGDPINVIE